VSAPRKTLSRTVAQNGILHLGVRLTVGFHRTLRVPDDGGSYPLPPSFGRFPLYACTDYRKRVPAAWNRSGSFFIPLYQREALWLGFDGEPWHPTALLIGADGVNVVTGGPWDAPLAGAPQNYVVVPDQPWLDGIRTSAGVVRQFVAMALGGGFTLSEQVRQRSSNRGIQLRAHEAKRGRFPDRPPRLTVDLDISMMMRSPGRGAALGIGAGGEIAQKIYPDTYGFESWRSDGAASAQVHIVNSAQFSSITGETPPPSPISAADYTKRGFPWFKLWDEERGDLGAQTVLEHVKSIGAVDASRDGDGGEPAIHIAENQIENVRQPKSTRLRKR
jgi:hypothetical protein